MFGERHYVPVLKWKRGEQKALELLDPKWKTRCTPLIEVMPVPWDHANDCPAKNVEEHLRNIGEQIIGAWSADNPVFLDLCWLDPSERMHDGSHPLDYVMNGCRSKSARAIPVTGLERDAQYQEAVKRAYREDGFGVCLRLEDADFLNLDSIPSFLGNLEITPQFTDLVVDFKYVISGDERKNVLSIITVLNSMPYIEDWRTLTICASAFPENLGSISPSSTDIIVRSEWIIWNELRNLKGRIKRLPTFGDYAIAGPSYVDIDPRIMQMSANIRYTVEDAYLIFKGKTIKKHGWEQIHNMCDDLVNDARYCGKDFCYGDNYIHECACRAGSTGNAETWRRAGTNHHLTFVSTKIASLYGI